MIALLMSDKDFQECFLLNSNNFLNLHLIITKVLYWSYKDKKNYMVYRDNLYMVISNHSIAFREDHRLRLLFKG